MKLPGLWAAAAACALTLGARGAIADRVSPGLRAGGTSGAHAVGASSTPAAARPALWRTYDMIVDLQDLPRTYTCDQLWYEFHGILLRLGAWPYSINILPYHCSPSTSGDMKSPDVQVHFQLPIFLHGDVVKAAPAQAIERTIRLAPGEPKTLHGSDCQLMRQVSATLFASIPGHVDDERFDCSAPPQRSRDFSVSLTLPMAAQLPALKITSAAVPH
jgi:hypothetical protein